MMNLFVTGASGHLGRRVAELLLDRGAGRIVAGSRSPGRLADLEARGAQARAADFDDPASLDAAFAGIDRLLLVSADGLGAPGHRRLQHLTAVAAAVRAGVKEIAYTSMPNPEPPSPISFAPDHWATEQAIEASGMRWTILRNNWYDENLRHAMPAALASGKWYTAAGDGRIAYVTREDTAQAAAAVMAGGMSNIRYDITGPEGLSTTDIAQRVAARFGKPIEVVQVSDEQLRAGLVAAGVPPAGAQLIVEYDQNTRAGRLATVTDAVERLTGRKPQTLEAWLARESA